MDSCRVRDKDPTCLFLPVSHLEAMKSKTQEFLYMMLWACEMATRPTFRNITESFEGWAYRKGLRLQLAALEKQKLLESTLDPDGSRLHRLTDTGRILASGEIDPVGRWRRHWDRKWRLVVFDVPQSRASDRARLRRFLASRNFGYLQKSVWVTPDPLTNEREAMGDSRAEVESLILLDARPCAGESNEQIVAGAWDFEQINKSYEEYILVLERFPRSRVSDESAATKLHRWFCDERLAWNEVMQQDPLLPKCLHPTGYRGIEIWQKRIEIMAEAGRKMRSFVRGG
jgi:phenylacetic acid degradation operon negative regulatory protein